MTTPFSTITTTPFRVGFITDEVSQDLETALKFARDFNVEWVELRNLWNTYVTDLNSKDIERAQRLLEKYQLKVSAIDTAYLKCILPGTKNSLATSLPETIRFQEYAYEEQENLLSRAMEKAKAFNTPLLRIFSFWRVENPEEVFDQAVEYLKRAARQAEAAGIQLGLENEHDCNIATGAESSKILQAISSKVFGLIWDPGNAFFAGENPYPDGYSRLDVGRILHVHVKDAAVNPSNKTYHWTAVGNGQIDFVGQFRALYRAGYTRGISLETHYAPPNGNQQEGSSQSMRGLLEALSQATKDE